MTGLLLLILAIITILISFLIFQSLGGKLVGTEIEEIGLFMGPPLFSFKLAGIKFRLNFIPLGAFVKFVEDFQNLSPAKKLVTILAGLVSYFVIALIGIGFTEALTETLAGFSQIFNGAFSPLGVGSKLIESMANVLRERSFLSGLGILAAKFLALNLLPIGSLSGGLMVITILEFLGVKSEKFSEKFQLIGLLFLLIILVAWFAAFIAFAARTI